MTFTKEQMETLSRYEQYFHTAVKANYCRYPGKDILTTIHGILSSATNTKRELNTGCQHCVFVLVRDCGRIYFADKEAYAALDKKEVKTEDIPAKKERVSVKTKAGKNKETTKK